MNSGSNGISSWWKDLCSLDLGSMETSSEYYVKDMYKSLLSEGNLEFRNLWAKVENKAIPFKVLCLVWRLLQNRIATKVNLVMRVLVFQGWDMCVGDCGIKELISHLFFRVSYYYRCTKFHMQMVRHLFCSAQC